MSSRALRKMQKQQELLQQLNNTHEEDESEVENFPKPQALNAFDMLVGAGDADDDEADIKDPNDPNDPNDAHSEATEHKITPLPSTGAKKNKGRKKKKKAKIEKDAPKGRRSPGSEGGLDEIDLALKATYPEPSQSNDHSSAVDNTYLDVCGLLAVDPKQLNALNEMKRLFGNAVLEGDGEGSGGPNHGRRRGRLQQHLDLGEAFNGRNSPVSNGQGLAGLALRRNAFMTGKEEWPKATSGGLGMEVVKIGPNGITEYRFVHNTFYQDIQNQFAACVESMEPQRMIQMLQYNPYHISTLLQVSEIAKQQGDHSVAGDLLERALYSFGRSVHSSFAAALSEGKVRLDFRRPENREFWLATWRYIINLGQRGTWRTAYEWAKLLLSLDPEGDPFCVVLIIDQLALRGGQSAHFLKLGNSSLYHRLWILRPNIQVSSALAEYKTKQVSKATDVLREAVSAYPWIFGRLFQVLNIDKIPASIWGKEPRSNREKFDCEMYIHGSKDVWNTPQTIALLAEAAGSTAVRKPAPVHEDPITLNEARHVFLSGAPTLLSLVPREFTSMTANSSDPLPPDDSFPSYVIVSDPDNHDDFRRIFDELDELNVEDLPNNFRHLELGDDESHSEVQAEVQGPRGLQSILRLIPWVTITGVHEGPPPDLNSVASNPETNQGSIMDFLRRTVNRDVIPAHFLGRNPEGEATASTAENQEPPHPDTAINTPTPPNSSNTPSPSHTQPDPPAEPIQEPYDDERNQRWLAGQGMVRLRDFITAHGVDDDAWSPAEIAAEGRQVLGEYAGRVLLLREQRTRNFIIDYVLKQGTSGEVRALVLHEVDRLRRGS